MDGQLRMVTGPDGIGLAVQTAGRGTPPILLVHGGTADRHRWAPLWPLLSQARQVSAMDRRGRGDSGDAPTYDLAMEFGDVLAVAEELASESGGPIDVFGHSYGAVCTIGAAAAGAPFRRMVLYEPPSVETVEANVVGQIEEWLDADRDEDALRFFLLEVIGRSEAEVEALRGTPSWQRRLRAIRTLPREGTALRGLDLSSLARQISQQVLLVLGLASPPWAAAVAEPLAQALPDVRWLRLDGQGHMAIDTAPDLLGREILAFFGAT